MNDKKLISESVDILRGWGVLVEDKETINMISSKMSLRPKGMRMALSGSARDVRKTKEGWEARAVYISDEVMTTDQVMKAVQERYKNLIDKYDLSVDVEEMTAKGRQYFTVALKLKDKAESVEEGKIANVLLTLTLLGGQSGVALAGIAKDQHSLKKQGIELVQKMQDKGQRKVVFKVAKDKAKDAYVKLKKMAGDVGVSVKAGVKEYKSQQSEVAAGHPRIVNGPSGTVGGGRYRAYGR